MFNQYGIGQDDMGILVLFSSGDRDVRIETGRQMQFYITDSKSGQLLDNYGMEYFRQDQFAEGLISLQDGIISEIKAVVPSDWNATKEQEPVQNTEEVNQPEEVLQVPENTSKDPTEKQSKGGIFGFLAVIGSMLVGLVVSIKKFFSTKGKLKESQEEKEQLEAKLAWEKKENESKIQQAQEYFKEKLEETKQRHLRERASLERDIKACQDEVNLRQEEVSRMKELAGAKQRELEGKLDNLKSEKAKLQSQVEELQEKLERVQKLHPEFDFETEVQEMIKKEFQEAAQEIDQELAKYLSTPASDGAESYFDSAITRYYSVQREVKAYLTTDVQELVRLRDVSRVLHWKALAIEADKKFEPYLAMIADKDHVRDLERAVREYDAYPPEVQRHMTTDGSKLSQLCGKSVSLKQKFEKEEQEKKDKAEAQRICDALQRVIRNNPEGTHDN